VTSDDHTAERRALHHERWRLLREVQALLKGPMVVLGFVWLALLVVDLTRGLNGPLQLLVNAVWALFVVDFMLRLVIAPRKGAFLRRNWLSLISLLLPALRVLRAVRLFSILRAARATRSLSLLRLITSLNRGLGSTRIALQRRGVGYVAVITILVMFTGAAGMMQFESPSAVQEATLAAAGTTEVGLDSYGDALWWTAMLMTTLGSDYWPRTPEGRVLTVLLALYAFAVFGYITASIASFFVGRDHTSTLTSAASTSTAPTEIAAVRQELASIKEHLADLSAIVRPLSLPTGSPTTTNQRPSWRRGVGTTEANRVSGET
jgi:voltage-gated potassium channel